MTVMCLSFYGSLGKLQPLSISSLQSFSPATAGRFVPVKKCSVPEASEAVTAGESPSGTMGGSMDEGCQRPVRLLPTHPAPKPILSVQGLSWVFNSHVDQQPRSAGKHRVGAYGTSEPFHWNLERRQALYFHSSRVDKSIPTTTG